MHHSCCLFLTLSSPWFLRLELNKRYLLRQLLLSCFEAAMCQHLLQTELYEMLSAGVSQKVQPCQL